MKKTIPLVLLTVLLTCCSQEKKMLRQAANAVERSEFEKAVSYYDQILNKDSGSFFGNAGKGIVLSEFMGRHEAAIPYLERARRNTPEKTKPILNSNLGKSYHFVGNYERALYYYGQSQKDNDPKWADYDEFLSKRIADCKYAIEHPKIALPENQSITNVGTTINTDKPEYTPVVSNGKMYFTSKRPDSKNEKKNGIDGRYYEAIYVSDIQGDGTFSPPKRYTIPRSKKNGEAIMTISPDGSKMYVYRSGKIMETDMTSPDHKTEPLDKNVNFTSLQNHAALTADGNTMYFTAESENGRGGTDIFVTTRGDDGKWTEPKMLDFTINTEYDEEAPFVNEAGVLFFASNGHPGYGGFDIYKSSYVNGSWTQPENLGQPINSPGDDIYFSLAANSSKGYYASARPGGYGDLDIYKVHYVSTETSPCKPDEMLMINSTPDLNNPMVQTISLNVPEPYRNNVRSYRWDINGQPVAETSSSFQHTFTKADEYRIGAQLLVYCDTCPTLITRCSEKALTIDAPKVLTKEGEDRQNVLAGADTHSKNKKDKKRTNNEKSTANGMNDKIVASQSKRSSKTEPTDKEVAANGPSPDATSDSRESNASSETSSNSFISEADLTAMNWNVKTPSFGYNEFNVQDDIKGALDQNIEVMKSKNNLVLVINGYADSRGSAEYNKHLSLKRANAVKDYFISHGIPSKRIKSVKGLGESELVNNCSDGVECSEELHQQNRRVKVNVLPGTVKSSGSITINK
jgi:outer membrane protein OmpA-like peptidoglycan-associated protein